MSYQSRLDDITNKLNRLKTGGGESRPLVPADNNSAAVLQAKKHEELLELIGEIKAKLKEGGQNEGVKFLGSPDRLSKNNRAEMLLDSIIKPSLADTVNALFDFYYRFNSGIDDGTVQRFNKIAAEVFLEKCTPSELLRLSDKTKLPLKKRRRLDKLVEVYNETTPANIKKKLPELLILKNELEGYLNEKANEKTAAQLLKDNENSGNGGFEKFFILQISDILEQPVLAASREESNNETVFGLLDSVLNELFALRAENDLFRSEIMSVLAEIRRETKKSAMLNEKILAGLKHIKGESEGNEPYGDILDELSALKEDIKTALAFDKD